MSGPSSSPADAPAQQPGPGSSPSQPWPPPWLKTVGFVFGVALTFYEAVIEHSAHLVVYGPAFAFTGLPLAGGLESLLTFVTALLPGGGKRP